VPQPTTLLRAPLTAVGSFSMQHYIVLILTAFLNNQLVEKLIVFMNIIMVASVILFLILAIQREEDKVKRSLKEAAKMGDKGVCTILAKEVIRARKAISKINTSKAHLNSIQLQMKNQLGKKEHC
jgi:division protein CdvB (Snf7/Vps24/ESCRT-III family)